MLETRDTLTGLSGVALAVLLVVSACDSGFNKAPAKKRNNTTPTSTRDAGNGVDAGKRDAVFVPPPAEEDVPRDTTLLGLSASQTRRFCQAHQARLDALAAHYKEEDPLCSLLSGAESASSARTESRFVAQCEVALEECLEAGATGSRDTLLPDPLLNFDCDTWVRRDGCDPSTEVVANCLEQSVSVLAEALGALSSCQTGLETARDGLSTLSELAELESALFVTEACEPVHCVVSPAENPADAGSE